VDQYFQVGSATFKYGHFINAMLMFLLILVVLYYGVVRPLQVSRCESLGVIVGVNRVTPWLG
jgi:large-conductance mechanosensitive channel